MRPAAHVACLPDVGHRRARKPNRSWRSGWRGTKSVPRHAPLCSSRGVRCWGTPSVSHASAGLKARLTSSVSRGPTSDQMVSTSPIEQLVVKILMGLGWRAWMTSCSLNMLRPQACKRRRWPFESTNRSRAKGRFGRPTSVWSWCVVPEHFLAMSLCDRSKTCPDGSTTRRSRMRRRTAVIMSGSLDARMGCASAGVGPSRMTNESDMAHLRVKQGNWIRFTQKANQRGEIFRGL